MKEKRWQTLTTLNDGLDDPELIIHPEMLEAEEVEYTKGLERVVEFNTH